MIKFGVPQWWVQLKQRHQNSKLFNRLAIYIKISRYTSKYEGKIKFDKIWGTKMGGPSKF